MRPVVIATGGFLLAVLWMDLMFDVQIRGGADSIERREAALASIARYYRRVTTDAAPMSHLIAAVMLVQAVGIADEVLLHRIVSGWHALLVAFLGVVPIGLAILRIVPAAVRLGGRSDDPETQTDLARDIYRGHLFCFVAVAAFVALQLRLPG